MSDSYEKKIVSLEFDDSKFKRKAQDANITLEQLNENLEFKDIEKRAEIIASSFDRATNTMVRASDSLAESLEDVNEQYERFGDTGERVLDRMQSITYKIVDKINDSIVSIGLNMIKEVTTGGIAEGYKAYENKIKSTRVILENNKDLGLEGVDNILKELNDYAIKTVYSIDQMTQSLGNFTAMGVKAETAKEAIIGLSNAAALSGTTREEYNSAIYMLGRVVGEGSHMDARVWYTMERARIANIWEKQIIEVLKERETQGILSEGAKEALAKMSSGSTLRDTLHTGWLTSDIQIESLRRFSDETTELGQNAYRAASEIKTLGEGIDVLKESVSTVWKEIIENTFGNYEELKTTLTEIFNDILQPIIYDATGESPTMLYDLLQLANDFHQNGGAIALRRLVEAVLELFTDGFRVFNYAWHSIFGNQSGEDIVRGVDKLAEYFENITYSAQHIDAMSGFQKILELILSIIKFTVKVGGSVFDILRGGFYIVSDIVDKVGVLLNNLFGIETIAEGLDITADRIRLTIRYIVALVVWLYENIVAIITHPVEVVKAIGSIFEAIFNYFAGTEGSIIQRIGNFIKNIKNAICEAFGIHSPSTFMIFVGSMLAAGLAIGLTKGFSLITTAFGGLFNIVKDAAEAIGSIFSSFPDAIHETTGFLKTMGILAAGIVAISFLTSAEDLSRAKLWFKEFKSLLDSVAKAIMGIVAVAAVLMLATQADSFAILGISTTINGGKIEGLKELAFSSILRNILDIVSVMILFMIAITGIAYLLKKNNLWDHTEMALIIGGILATIAIFMTLIGVFVLAISKLSNSFQTEIKLGGITTSGNNLYKNLKSISTIITSISTGIVGIILSSLLFVKVINNMRMKDVTHDPMEDFGKLMKYIIGIAAGMLIMASWLVAISKGHDTGLYGKAFGLRHMTSNADGNSLKQLSKVITAISSSLKSIIISIGMVVGIVAAANYFNVDMGTVTIVLISIFVALGVIMAAIDKFAYSPSNVRFVETVKSIKSLLNAVSVILISLSLVLIPISIVAGFATNEMLDNMSRIAVIMGALIVIISVSLGLLIILSKQKSLNVNVWQLGVFFASISGLIIGISWIIGLVASEFKTAESASAFEKVAWTLLAAIPVMMALMSIVAVILKDVEWEEIGKISVLSVVLFTGLTAILMALSKIISESNEIKNVEEATRKFKAIGDFVQTLFSWIGIVTAAVIALTFATSGIGLAALAVVMIGIVIILGQIASVVKSLSDIKANATSAKDAIKEIYELMSSFGEIDIKASGIIQGQNWMDGVIQGIKSRAQNLSDIVVSTGQSMLDTMNKTLDEHSPSKEGAKTGKFFIKGIEKGVEDETENIGKTMEETGEWILETTNLSLGVPRARMSEPEDAGFEVPEEPKTGFWDKGFGKWLKDSANSIYNVVDKVTGIIPFTVNSVLDLVGDTSSARWQTLSGNIPSFNALKDKTISDVKDDLVGDVTNAISNGVSDILGSGEEGTEGVQNPIVSAIKTALDEIGLTDITETFNKLFGEGGIYNTGTIDPEDDKDESSNGGLTMNTSGVTSAVRGYMGTGSSNVTNTYAFYQTNNSPKSLSRTEIYRQTKNLLSKQKGVQNGVW